MRSRPALRLHIPESRERGARKAKAGARIRTADLLITNPGGTMSEAPVFCGLFQYNQQGTPFSLSAVFSPIGRFSIAN